MSKIEQKSYAISEDKENQPSEEILRLIEIANFVPGNEEIKGLIEFIENLDFQEIEEIIQITGRAFLNKIESDGFLDRWLETIKPFPNLYKWLMDCPPHRTRPDISSLIFGFQDFVHIRNKTNDIADYSELYRKQKGRVAGQSSRVPSAQLSVDEFGKIIISIDRVSEAFLGFDLARFKRCENCQKIIWAYRLNQKYCDKKCSNAFHQKKIRTDPKRNNEINEQRRANRERKNELKIMKMEKKKNGNL